MTVAPDRHSACREAIALEPVDADIEHVQGLRQLPRQCTEERLVATRATGAGEEAAHYLQPALLADILLDRDVVRHAAVGLAHRGNDFGLDVNLAVLAAVDELAAPDPAFAQRLPQIPVGRGGCLSRLQHGGIAAQHLFHRIARHLRRGGIDVLDAALQVGDDDAVGALLDGLCQLPHPLVDLPQVGDVLHRADHAQHPAGTIAHDVAAIEHGQIVPPGVAETVFVSPAQAFRIGQCVVETLRYAFAVPRVHPLQPPGRRLRLLDDLAPAEYHPACLAPGLRVLDRIPVPDHVAGGQQGQAQPFLVGFQGCLGPAQLGVLHFELELVHLQFMQQAVRIGIGARRSR